MLIKSAMGSVIIAQRLVVSSGQAMAVPNATWLLSSVGQSGCDRQTIRLRQGPVRFSAAISISVQPPFLRTRRLGDRRVPRVDAGIHRRAVACTSPPRPMRTSEARRWSPRPRAADHIGALPDQNLYRQCHHAGFAVVCSPSARSLILERTITDGAWPRRRDARIPR